MRCAKSPCCTRSVPTNNSWTADVIDFASTAMDPVWDAIEEAQVPVAHHIGENPPATPNEFNAVGIGMLQSVAPFRDAFGKYVLGGILDRHPGLQIGWFEGGINWVPSTIQDAQHIAASFHHLNNLEVQHDPRYYWDHHMHASFMVDPLGLDLVDRIGVDKILWEADYPHSDCVWPNSRKYLSEQLVDVPDDEARLIAGGNAKALLRL